MSIGSVAKDSKWNSVVVVRVASAVVFADLLPELNSIYSQAQGMERTAKLYNAEQDVIQAIGGNESTMAVKKGDVVRLVRDKFEGSLEATASDNRLPPYVFETKGEVLDTKGDYMFVKFGHVPTPGFWLRADQLEAFE